MDTDVELKLPTQPPRWRQIEPSQRLFHGAVAFGGAVTLIVARFLTPDPRGMGTHEQLGLPPCFTFTTLHIPCPFCGMTTAFALMAHGKIAQAIMTQPAGAAASIGTLVAVLVSGAFAVTARRPLLSKLTQWRRLGLLLLTTFVFAAWLFKIVETSRHR